ncbi:1017_t:CDS:2, partial [Entrophospora sp. SA101]
LPRSKSLNDATNTTSSSFISISSSPSISKLYSRLLHSKNSFKKPSIAQSYNVPIALDRYLTNEGHRLVVSHLRLSKIQTDIKNGRLHNLTEKDIDDFLKSCNGVATNSCETLNYQELKLSLPECKLLAMLLKIKELNIAYNNINGEGAKHLAKALKENKSIEKFNLESNDLNVVGGKHIGDMLKNNNTLKYLHLGRNNLQFVGIKHISESLVINKSIVSLSLDSNNIQPAGVNELAKVLKTNKNLTHLYLPSNNLGDVGLNYICKALLQNSTLIYLDLEFNNIGMGLSSLSNGNNGVDDEDDENVRIIGAKSLGKLLENHIVPRAINLTSNPIGNKGCELIFSGFHKNKTMESLLLSNCNIGLDGARVISESLKFNNGLQNLSLHKNLRLGVDGHLLIADALDKNTSLKGLQLDYNFDEWGSVGDTIQQCLTRNHFLQQEKYNTAYRILNASRIILNTKPNHNHQKTKLDELPLEISEQILSFLDPKNVLTELQIISIIKWSTRKDTLGSTLEDFLTKTLSAYYPITPDVRLWPTEVTDSDTINNRF